MPLLGKLEGEFLPEEDKGRLLCFVFAPEGSTTEYTDRQVRKMEAMLRDVPEVQAYGAVIAFALSGPGQANTGIVFVLLKDAKQRTRNVRDIVNEAAEFATNDPEPDPSELYTDIYAEAAH